MANQWYIRRGSKISSPRDSAQLKSDATTGFVKPTDEVSQSPTGPWTLAQKVKGLFPIPVSNSPVLLDSNPQHVETRPIRVEANSTSNASNNLHSSSSMRRSVLIFLLIFVFCVAWGTVVVPVWHQGSKRLDQIHTESQQAKHRYDIANAKADEALRGPLLRSSEIDSIRLELEQAQLITKSMDLGEGIALQQFDTQLNSMILWGFGAGIVADTLLLVGVLALQKIKFKS